MANKYEVPKEVAPSFPRMQIRRRVVDLLPNVVVVNGKWVLVPDEWVMPGGAVVTSKEVVDKYAETCDLRIVTEEHKL